MSESLYRLGREAERMREPEPPAKEWWKPAPDQQVELVPPKKHARWCSQ